MLDSDTPQFTTAEYSAAPSTDHCHYCQKEIASRYYRVNTHMACPACTEQAVLNAPQESHAAFMRALLFGTGAAVGGLGLYTAFEVATNIISALVALAVGWMVGKAMMAGSKSVGGRRYQIAAALLTYAAVSMAEIPVILWQSKSAATLVANHFGRLVMFGLTSPFLDLFLARTPGALIALVILFVGIRAAWKIAAGSGDPKIVGPFSASAPAPAST
jgi:hypothetical protein